MNDHAGDADQMIAGLRPVSVDALSRLPGTAGAEDLLRRIMATDVAEPSIVSSRTRPRLARALAVAATLALLGAIVGVGSSVILRPKAALANPVTFSERNGYISAVFTDPEATTAQIDAAFARRGFDIKVVLTPASPSLVGTVGSMVEDPSAQLHEIKVLYSTGCWTVGGGQHCPIGLLIPTDFSGQARIEVGRAAQAGEHYGSVTNAFFPDEVLHCSGVAGMTVGQAMPVLQGLGAQVIWRSMDRSIDDVHGIDPSVIQSQYVQYDSETVSPGVAYVWVSSQLPPTTTGLQPAFDQGC